MRLRNFYKGIFIFTVLSTSVFGQTQDSYEYQSEFIWGINKNTSGGLIGGFVFKKSRKLTDRLFETFGLEIMNVKHPQEVRVNSPTGNFFIHGKNNYLYAFRFQYGRDIILFKKAPQQGVEIKAVFAVGPSIGVHAPYYVEWSPNDGNGLYTIREQYYPEIEEKGVILGPGRLFEGLGESGIKFGGNLKAALNFELGVFKSQVTGFEAGFLLDAYTSTVEMVPGTKADPIKNYSAFPTLFISFFYGSRK
jgi:hypothetical protein